MSAKWTLDNPPSRERKEGPIEQLFFTLLGIVLMVTLTIARFAFVALGAYVVGSALGLW